MSSIELHTARYADGFRPEPKFTQALGIGLILRAHTREGREQRTKEKPKPFVATIRTLREPGVDKK